MTAEEFYEKMHPARPKVIGFNYQELMAFSNAYAEAENQLLKEILNDIRDQCIKSDYDKVEDILNLHYDHYQ